MLFQDEYTTTDGDVYGACSFSDKTRQILRDAEAAGEPIFVFRAKDLLSVMVINHYLALLENYIPAEAPICEGVVDDLNLFRHWQLAHSDLVRLPD